MKSVSIVLGLIILATNASAGIVGGGSSGSSGGNGGKNLKPNVTMFSPGDELISIEKSSSHDISLSSTGELKLGLSVSDYDLLKHKMEKDLGDVRTVAIEGQLYDLAAIEDDYMVFVSDDGQGIIVEQSRDSLATEEFRLLD